MPVPFYVLCGSLGAGKTTLLMRLLEHWKAQGLRAGVLMNEAGDISIDGPRAGTIAEQVMNLAGGCVCCDTKEDLSWGIAQLVRDYSSDVVILECSGLADPAEVKEDLSWGIAQLVRDYSSDVVILECSGLADPAEVVDAVTDLYTARLARLERIIALLHPVSAEESHSSAYVTTQAIRCADELILNKQDLYVPGHWESFRNQILTQNPYARLWETTHARIAPSALLAPRASAGPTTPTNVLFDKSPAKARPRAAYHPIATAIRLTGTINRPQFLAWLKTLPKELERAKGYFRFTNAPELQEFQYSPPGQSTITPITLLDEPEPAIVLIGRGYDVEVLKKNLLGCVETRSA
ncbi:MAG: hypothetical protein HP498_00500 [Nitrospira sp.]|nr:hypothetical protein [Nitrospira sp.]